MGGGDSLRCLAEVSYFNQTLGNVTFYEWLYGPKPNLGNMPEWGQQICVNAIECTYCSSALTSALCVQYCNIYTVAEYNDLDEYH